VLCGSQYAFSEPSSAINAPTQFAAFGDRRIAYRVIGKGTPLILANRFRGNLDDWDPAFLDALAVNYKVYTFDYAGFGRSEGEPPETIKQFAEDVIEFAATLELGRFAILGWSFGGAVAQIVTTEFPELTTHMVLIGTRPPGQNEYSISEQFYEHALKPVNDLDDEIVLFFRPESASSRDAAKASHERIASRTSDRDIPIAESLWQYYTKGFADFEADPYGAREKLMSTSIPVLVISADWEICFPPENWFALNQELPTTQVLVVPQTGHGPQHQYPNMIGSYIDTFIRSH
jgi:pimeloyl-ACP methyl ester carboxylesterase